MSNANDFIIEGGVLKKYTGSDAIVRIPEGIAEIGVCAFIMRNELKSVEIPAGVGRIGNGAFYGCKNLSRVVIPGSVTEIGREAFSGCEGLSKLELSDGLKRIDFGVFNGCKSLRQVTIPESVTDLGYEAFRGCPGLADENGFVILRDSLFGYYGPGGDVVVPDGVRRICNGTFHTGGELTSLKLADSVVELGDDLFQDCQNLADENGFVILRDAFYGYYSQDPHVVIPEGVARIGRRAFFMDADIRSVVLPKGVVQIGISAFYSCKNLKDILIPEGVMAIGHDAFEECFSLTRVAIPESAKWIGDRVFQNCRMLKEVILPREVSYMGADVFNRCQNLTSLVLPEGVTRIDTRTFAGCVRLAELVVPKSVTSIANEAFSDCGSLANVMISGTTVTVGSNAFRGISPQAVICAPGSAIDLYQTPAEKQAAARGYMKRPELYPDKAVADSYKKYLVAQRKNLLSYVFQQDLAQVLALYAEKKKITVDNFETEYMGPAQEAKAVGCVAYLMDWSNANITAKALEKKDQRELAKDPFNVTDMKKLWSYETMEDGTLMITSYKGAEAEVVVPERIGKTPVTRLDDGAFGIMTKTGTAKPKKQIAVLQAIKSVAIPGSVTSIGDKAFYECKELKTVEIPDSVTEIGAEAFYGCKSLESVKIPDSVTQIGSLAFCGCQNLADENGLVRVRDVVYGYSGPGSSLVIPYGVTRIEDRAFVGSNTLTHVEMPDSVTDMGECAFMNCGNLKTVRLSANLAAVSDFAFSGCASLQSVEIPQGVTEIGNYAFSDCKKLAKLVLPDSVAVLGRDAFRMCDKLADENGFVVVRGVLYRYCGSGGDIIVPAGVTKIGTEAFAQRKKLTSVVIPDGVTSIGYFAFSGCSNLKRIVIPASVTEMILPFGWSSQPKIQAPAGSYAEQYAKENKLPFVAE